MSEHTVVSGSLQFAVSVMSGKEVVCYCYCFREPTAQKKGECRRNPARSVSNGTTAVRAPILLPNICAMQVQRAGKQGFGCSRDVSVLLLRI